MLDSNLLFTAKTGQAITASAISTNKIPVAPQRNLGVGTPLYLVCIVTEAFVGAGATVAVKLQKDDDSTFGSATDVQTLGTFGALSAIGTKIQVPLTLDDIDEDYLALYFTMAGGTLTGGKIAAFISDKVDAWKAYPEGSPAFEL